MIKVDMNRCDVINMMTYVADVVFVTVSDFKILRKALRTT